LIPAKKEDCFTHTTCVTSTAEPLVRQKEAWRKAEADEFCDSGKKEKVRTNIREGLKMATEKFTASGYRGRH